MNRDCATAFVVAGLIKGTGVTSILKIFEIKNGKKCFYVGSLLGILTDGSLYKLYDKSGRFDGYTFYSKRKRLNIVNQSSYLNFMRKMISLNAIFHDENDFSCLSDIIQYLFSNKKALEIHLFNGRLLYGFIVSYNAEQINMKALNFNGDVYKDNVNILIANIKELFFDSPGLKKYEFLLQEDVVDYVKEMPVIYSKRPLLIFHTLCAIFFGSTYFFEVGYINGIDNGKIIVELIDEKGLYDGVLIKDIKEVSKISYRGNYLKTINKLVNIHKSRLEMLNIKKFSEIIEYCYENQILIKITTSNRKTYDYAIIKEIKPSDILCSYYDKYARYIGERKYSLDSIIYFCFNDSATTKSNQLIKHKYLSNKE